MVKRERQGRNSGWARMLGLAVLVIAIGALAYVKGRRPLLAALATGPEYHARFPTVGGLRKGDEVRYGGISVGRTRSVDIDPRDPSKILVVFRVDERTPMRRDVLASVVDVSDPVTRYLSLRPGRGEAPPLPPGHEVETETGPTLEQTLTRVAVLLQRTDTLLDAAAPIIHGDFFARLDRTTARLDQMTTAVVRSSARWGPGLERAVGRLDTAMDHTGRLLAALDSATPELRAASTEALGMLEDTRLLVAELRTGAAQGGGVDELMQNLTDASENLSRVAARLERNPASLLSGQQPITKTAGPPIDE